MNKKAFAGIIIIIFLLTSLGFAIYLVGQQQETRSKAAPASSISLTPAQYNVTPGETLTINAVIEPSGGNLVNSATIYITFNSAIFEGVSIENGPSMPTILEEGNIDNDLGTATIEVGNLNNPLSQSGTVAVLTLTVKEDAPSTAETIEFVQSQTQARAEAEPGVNALVLFNPSTINIQGDAVSPSPSPVAPSASPGASPLPDDGEGGATNLSPSPSAQTSTSPQPSSLPAAGSLQPTQVFLSTGIIFLLLGFVAIIL